LRDSQGTKPSQLFFVRCSSDKRNEMKLFDDLIVVGAPETNHYFRKSARILFWRRRKWHLLWHLDKAREINPYDKSIFTNYDVPILEKGKQAFESLYKKVKSISFHSASWYENWKDRKGAVMGYKNYLNRSKAKFTDSSWKKIIQEWRICARLMYTKDGLWMKVKYWGFTRNCGENFERRGK